MHVICFFQHHFTDLRIPWGYCMALPKGLNWEEVKGLKCWAMRDLRLTELCPVQGSGDLVTIAGQVKSHFHGYPIKDEHMLVTASWKIFVSCDVTDKVQCKLNIYEFHTWCPFNWESNLVFLQACSRAPKINSNFLLCGRLFQVDTILLYAYLAPKVYVYIVLFVGSIAIDEKYCLKPCTMFTISSRILSCMNNTISRDWLGKT